MKVSRDRWWTHLAYFAVELVALLLQALPLQRRLHHVVRLRLRLAALLGRLRLGADRLEPRDQLLDLWQRRIKM